MPSDVSEIIEPPVDPSNWNEWRTEMHSWRVERRATLNYVGETYRRPEYQWVSSCYSCNMLMAWDETFLDSVNGKYKVEEYLHENARHFGGYDAVVLWHAYPRIGFDRRNQTDYYRELPGGLDGLKDVVRRFHAHRARVFIDYNPWDTGTRREPMTDAEAIASVVHATGVDGIFLDTLKQGSLDMRHAVDRARPGVAFESEDALPLEGLSLNHLSWAQWFGYGEVPGLLRNKWFEQRHMMHVIRRWDTDHTNELHLAWMNGVGMLVWENVFGSWVGWSAPDRKLLRDMTPIQRHFTRHFSEGTWTPLIPTGKAGVYAHRWDHDGTTLYTIVNRRGQATKGSPVEIKADPGESVYDLLTGLPAELGSMEVPGLGIGALLVAPKDRQSPELNAFLSSKAAIQGLSDRTSRSLHPLSIAPRTETSGTLPAPSDMIVVNAGEHSVQTHFRVRECGERDYARLLDSSYPGLHQDVAEHRTFRLGRFAVSRGDVTNIEFLRFVQATGYRPRVRENFLLHWVDGKPKSGEENLPVVYVDLLDAREYARWRGMRLPTEAEWQVAMAQANPDRGERPVWNWTDSEYSDGRTRFCLIKGGSWFEAKGSEWYADGGEKGPEFAAKFIEIWPGLDRCETLGFRLATSLE
ncbi:MAG: SUMF1/EgtB/PvdO family nonheme iron enzyme [Fimbriimonas sp.]|nr:SUMF1/EgtB/PvdO family nonheme iron enzyme [Fimbriimonas sp.]